MRLRKVLNDRGKLWVHISGPLLGPPTAAGVSAYGTEEGRQELPRSVSQRSGSHLQTALKPGHPVALGFVGRHPPEVTTKRKNLLEWLEFSKGQIRKYGHTKPSGTKLCHLHHSQMMIGQLIGGSRLKICGATRASKMGKQMQGAESEHSC